MARDPDSIRRRLVPLGLLGTIVLVVAIERSVVRHDLHLINSTAQNWRHKGMLARAGFPRCQVLCFGSSLVSCGALPHVIEHQSGQRTYNLAVFGGPLPASYYLLDRALRAGSRPAAVLLDSQPWPIERVRRHEPSVALWDCIQLWPELLSLGEGLDLAWSARDARFFATVMLARLLPSYKARFPIRACILAALRNGTTSVSFNNAACSRNWMLNRGAIVLADGAAALPVARGVSAPRAHAPRLAEFPRGSVIRDPVGMRYARRFVELAARHDILVFWLLPPFRPDTQARNNRSGLSLFFTQFARDMQARYSNVVVIDAGPAGYPHDAFSDGLHLNGRGACTFSAEVASIVGRCLDDQTSSARWWTLPAYRDRTFAVPLEDLVQSQLILRHDAERIRR